MWKGDGRVMAITTSIKDGLNSLLGGVNLRIDTLTAERVEAGRLARLEAAGHFEQAAFPVPPALQEMDPAPLFTAVREHATQLANLESPSTNAVGFSFSNPYFGSPDADVLYAVVRHFRPSRIVEIGSGHSTRVSRQAILDGQLGTNLSCIDPCPRVDVATLADEVFLHPVETLLNDPLFTQLGPGDILFIDSSHMLSPGNDCVALYLHVLPRLTAGVLIHVHDVFLPYDYPREWVVQNRWLWNEQYLVQTMLQFGDAFEVLWAGHYLQRTDPQFAARMPRAATKPAASMWLRKK